MYALDGNAGYIEADVMHQRLFWPINLEFGITCNLGLPFAKKKKKNSIGIFLPLPKKLSHS